jgi:hypothetical protein
MNSVHNHQSRFRYSKWYHPFRLYNKNFLNISHFPYTYHTACVYLHATTTLRHIMGWVLLETLIVTQLFKNVQHIWNPKAINGIADVSIDHIPSQFNPVHKFSTFFSKINFNIILPSMSRSPKQYLLWGAPTNFYVLIIFRRVLHASPISPSCLLSCVSLYHLVTCLYVPIFSSALRFEIHCCNIYLYWYLSLIPFSLFLGTLVL